MAVTKQPPNEINFMETNQINTPDESGKKVWNAPALTELTVALDTHNTGGGMLTDGVTVT